MTRINQIAQAFAAGVAFARSTGLAMDAAEEDKGYWRTIRGHKITSDRTVKQPTRQIGLRAPLREGQSRVNHQKISQPS